MTLKGGTRWAIFQGRSPDLVRFDLNDKIRLDNASGDGYMFLGVSHAPYPKGMAQRSRIFVISYVRPYSMTQQSKFVP